MDDKFESFLADIETASPTELLQVQCQLLWFQLRRLAVIQHGLVAIHNRLTDVEKAVKLMGAIYE